KRSRDTEQGTDNGQYVDHVTDPTFDAIAEERLKGPPHRNRTPAAMNCVGQRKTDYGIDSPWVKAPVEESLGHRVAGKVRSFASPPCFRRGGCIPQWLTNTVEN